jgi:hypothetical protein
VSLDRPAKPPDRPDPQPAADPPEPSGDPWGVESLTRAQAFESLRAQTAPTDTAPLTDHPRNYWAEVPRCSAMWRSHTERWPTARSQDQHEQPATAGLDRVDTEAERITQAEGGITSDVQRIAGDCSRRTWLGGFEYRLKGSDRIKEKVADKLAAEPDRSLAEVVQAMPDAIRYTYCFDTDDYASGYSDVKGKLEASGYEMYYGKNFWLDSEYKGINSRWITPGGQRFEIQFHTPESFHAKHEVTHRAYERIRDPRTSEHERGELREFQREVSRLIPVPEGIRAIPDYKKEGF